jgi:hypothetical protein
VCSRARAAALVGFGQIVERALNDRELSPEEETILLEYQREVGLTAADVASYLPRLVRAKGLYQIGTGVLPIVAPPVVLHKGERCHLAISAVLFEERIKTVRVGQSRGTSFRVCRGVTIRSGASKGYSVPVSEVIEKERGTICVTNKRFLFVGGRTMAVPLASVVSVDAFLDGISVHHEKRTKEQFFTVQDGEWAAAVLLAAAQAAQALCLLTV